MNDRKVAAYLGKQIHLRSQRTQVTADEVIRALANIAFFDIRKIFEEDGTFKAIVDMDEDTAAAIESVESTTRTDQYGNSTTTTKLKFHSKMSALDILARHLGMLDSRLKVEHTGSVDIIGQILSKVESEKSNVIDSDAIRLEAEKT
jgi:phage terminase small subunit